jgi:uncharacterized membrane protein YhhN
MKHITAKTFSIAIAIFAATSVALLWSWNTLAELSGAPVAEFKHVLAALFVLATVRVFMTPRRHRQHLRH